MKTFLKGFVYAGRGIWFCLRHERNFRIHLVVAAYVLGFAPSFTLSRAEWAVLIVTLGLVPAAEALNTAVEHAMDLVSPRRNPMVAIAKDAAAGAVLLCAVASVGVGVALFGDGQALAALWGALVAAPWKLALIAVSLIPSLWIIVRGGVAKA